MFMRKLKQQLLKVMRQRSDTRAAQLSRVYLKVSPQQREELMAGIMIEKWLSRLCDECDN